MLFNNNTNISFTAESCTGEGNPLALFDASVCGTQAHFGMSIYDVKEEVTQLDKIFTDFNIFKENVLKDIAERHAFELHPVIPEPVVDDTPITSDTPIASDTPITDDVENNESVKDDALKEDNVTEDNDSVTVDDQVEIPAEEEEE